MDGVSDASTASQIGDRTNVWDISTACLHVRYLGLPALSSLFVLESDIGDLYTTDIGNREHKECFIHKEEESTRRKHSDNSSIADVYRARLVSIAPFLMKNCSRYVDMPVAPARKVDCA